MSTLYEKRGRRYHPVHDTAAMDGLGNGAWLVVVRDGLVSVRKAVDDGPEVARVAAVADKLTGGNRKERRRQAAMARKAKP